MLIAGYGAGEVVDLFNDKADLKITGVDVSSHMIEYAQQYYARPNISIYQEDLVSLSVPANHYDCI